MIEYDFITYILQPFVIALMILTPFVFYYMAVEEEDSKDNKEGEE